MTPEEIYNKLREPIDIKYVSWKINSYNKSKTKAQITFHIDARVVQHLLNSVVGLDGWRFSYTESGDGSIHGKLGIWFDTGTDGELSRLVEREDVGYTNGTSEPLKDAVSDALKRCAVHFGVGHFLYAMPMLWIDLTEEGQKYLTQEQDAYIANWLKTRLEAMNGKKTVSKEPVETVEAIKEEPASSVLEGDLKDGDRIGSWTLRVRTKKDGTKFNVIVHDTEPDPVNPRYKLSYPEWTDGYRNVIDEELDKMTDVNF